jgi:hypothetical protein
MWQDRLDEKGSIVKPMMKKVARNPGDKVPISAEEPFQDVGFKVHKFSVRPRPSDKNKVLLICCFSEFGCETMGVVYCIPRITKDRPRDYRIAVGWSGRSYMYRHLVDEFWELNEGHMWLREYSRAFHHESRNLARLEKSLKDHGTVVPSSYLGRIAISAKCFDCRLFYPTVYANGSYDKSHCIRCGSTNVLPPIMGDVAYWKPKAVRIPPPSMESLGRVDRLLGRRPVGVFARARKCYGRNLQPSFYTGLVSLLKSRGYDPIWLGERESTMACPARDVVDFSRMSESRDLENTLAIVSRCEFTVQFWTASSRLSGLMGVPYLLFESPDQIWGGGQEGIRRNLCDFGNRKLSVNHYLNVYENNGAGLEIVDECISEMESGNYCDHIGMVDPSVVRSMKDGNSKRIGDL